MTEQLDPRPTDRVLEIGTGSGYQAAVLSPLVKEVYTIEIVDHLARRAEQTLKRLEYENVHVRSGDGYEGWPEAAPFDKIIVTCSPEAIPQPLIDQLAEGGEMIIPVGELYQQNLIRVTKHGAELEKEPLQATLFVPMTGTAEQERQVQPDLSVPQVVNGNFEQVFGKSLLPAGWHYLRQVRTVDGFTRRKSVPFVYQHRAWQTKSGAAGSGPRWQTHPRGAALSADSGQRFSTRSFGPTIAGNYPHVLRSAPGRDQISSSWTLAGHFRLAVSGRGVSRPCHFTRSDHSLGPPGGCRSAGFGRRDPDRALTPRTVGRGWPIRAIPKPRNP